MMDQKLSGFQERPHTADWALDVWAPDFLSLLQEAARGMYALMGARLAAGSRQRRTIDLSWTDRESLLVSFLSELLYYGEQEGMGFDRMDLQLLPGRLTGSLEGAPLISQTKEIKAVTYHRLAVRETPGRLSVTLTFDV